MIETHLNLFDAGVIGVMVLSCLFAFFRGFVREMLSLGAWIGAALVTVYYFPHVAAMLKPHFKSTVGATGVATLGVYTAALIAFSIFNAIILKFVRSGKEVGMLDNLLGLGFGMGRGALLVSLGYFILTIAMPEKEYPQWLQTSVTRPYAEKGAVVLAKAAPDYLREISSLQKKANAELEAARQRPDDGSDEPVVVQRESDDDASYSRSENQQMDRLIQGMSPSR
ncbi:MAG: CvpA family protein [Rickettsiales bacterium]|nr:CvpA family protein [Rickettsiales bacterium]